MCEWCGCGDPDAPPKHAHGEGSSHSHAHGAESRTVRIGREILAENKTHAEQNRKYFRRERIFSVNLMSAPGSGKTTLLKSTIRSLPKDISVFVLTGDQETSLDAESIREAGGRVHQINTHSMCHLDAHLVAHGLEALSCKGPALLFIENIGNLVCPALFDLGEARRVALLSTPEGEDKPLKYPGLFRIADTVVLSKMDLAGVIGFDREACERSARSVNPQVEILALSARTGEGMEEWHRWLEKRLHE
ncbi:MAG: hydrogenase nickel incorporation protein HypB [Acidobacteriota bacterium]|nr:MAG: hydrogenase nickel incorporation protein HypB [Acidobacteriota bacterium]